MGSEAEEWILERLRALRRRYPAASVIVGWMNERSASQRLIVASEENVSGCYFDIASLTKPITGLLTAALVEDGVVRLHQPLNDFVDAGANGEITIMRLATHTSGLPRLPPCASRVDVNDPYGPCDAESLLAGLRETPRVHSDAFEYSNFGYMILGHVLTVATGASYDDLLARILCTTIGENGLTASGSPKRMIAGMRRGNRVPHWNRPVIGSAGVAATPAALMALLRQCVRPDGASYRWHDLAQRVHVWTGPDRGIGLGWHVSADLRWHNGASGGFRSFMGFVPRHYGVFAVANESTAKELETLCLGFLSRCRAASSSGLA